MDVLAAYSPLLTGAGLPALGATLLVMAVLTGLGSVVGGRGLAGDIVVGLGLAGGVLAIWGVAGLELSPAALALGICGVAAAVRTLEGGGRPGGRLWATLLILLPLLLIASLTVATMWDDFWHWLPNAGYVFRYDHLPGPDQPDSMSKWPAYPYTMPFVVATASWIAGGFLESAGPVANVVLLGAFGAMAVEAAAPGDRLPVWTGAAVAAALGTVLNPAFDPGVLFASYADVATAVITAACGLLGVRLLAALAEDEAPLGSALRLAFAFTALVNLKQANAVLLALLAAGLLVVGWRMSARVAARLVRWAPVVFGPAVLVFMIWRIEVARLPAAGEMAFRHPDTWNYDSIGPMTDSLWRYMSEAPVFYALLYAAFAFGLANLFRRLETPARRLLALTALAWAGYNAFLILVYLGAMTAAEADMAADYWRYAPHLGLLALAGVAIAVLDAVRPYLEKPAGLAALAAPVVIVALVLVGSVITPLSKTWPMHYRAVGHDLPGLLPDGARVAVYVGHNFDAMAVAIRYDLTAPGRLFDRTLNDRIIWHGEDLHPVMEEVRSGAVTHILITDANKPMDDAERDLGLPHLDRETALFAWSGEGWRKLKSWPTGR